MLFWKKKTPPLVQSSASAWREQWRAIVPPECRNVPVTVGDKTVTAYVQINHFVMMLQDGLLMEEHFFDVCSHFQRAGYHVIWLMRCTQDIENGYLKLKKQRGDKCLWKWRKPTTNFGRWTSDNRCVTILLQYKPAPDGPLEHCTEHILQRVQWAESSDNAQMVPSRTEFATVGVPGTPAELAKAFHVKRELGLRGGLLVTNPIPEEYSMDKAVIDKAIAEAVENAKKDGIHGKATTPYLLAKIKDLTGGDSLDSNIQLVFNNARLGAAAAVELAKLER